MLLASIAIEQYAIIKVDIKQTNPIIDININIYINLFERFGCFEILG